MSKPRKAARAGSMPPAARSRWKARRSRGRYAGRQGLAAGAARAAELRPQGQGLLDGSVAEVVFLGAEVRAIVAVDADRRVSVRCGRSVAPRVGEAVGVHWDMARATLLQQ